MIKSVIWVAVGAAGALTLDKWLDKSKARFSPAAITGSALDKLNDKLEDARGSSTDVRSDRV